MRFLTECYDTFSVSNSWIAGTFSNFMRQEAMAEKMVFNRPIPVNRLVSAIADSAFLHYIFSFH